MGGSGLLLAARVRVPRVALRKVGRLGTRHLLVEVREATGVGRRIASDERCRSNVVRVGGTVRVAGGTALKPPEAVALGFVRLVGERASPHHFKELSTISIFVAELLTIRPCVNALGAKGNESEEGDGLAGKRALSLGTTREQNHENAHERRGLAHLDSGGRARF